MLVISAIPDLKDGGLLLVKPSSSFYYMSYGGALISTDADFTSQIAVGPDLWTLVNPHRWTFYQRKGSEIRIFYDILPLS